MESHQKQNVALQFNQDPKINRWTIDLDDIDRVLRIELKTQHPEGDIIERLEQIGIECTLLPD